MRRKLVWWLGVAVSIAFVYVAARDVELDRVRDGLGAGDYAILFPALAVLGLGVVLRALRWRVFFVPEARPALWPVTSALLIGYLFNSILPARAGEAVRIVVLNQRARTSRAETLATVVAERVLDVLVLLGLLLVTAPFTPESSWMRGAALVGGGAFALLLLSLVVLAFFGERPLRFVLRPLLRFSAVTPAHLNRAASNLIRGLEVFRAPRIALQAIALTTASWLVIAFSFWLCMAAVHVDAGMDAALLVVVAVNLAMILPSGPAGIGVFEAATVLALAPFGVDRSQALTYAIVVHAVNFFPLVIAGYLALLEHARAIARRSAEPHGSSDVSTVELIGSGRTSS